jgi:AraC family transcriptional regulator of adaptative response / DNA-3-methyladenine glycosylase II
VLGQQVSVRAATTLAGRLVVAFGTPIPDGEPGLDAAFPTPWALAEASTDAISAIGLPATRARTVRAVAQAIAMERVDLGAGADPEQAVDALQALPGIGPWTASYIAMRALGWTDGFLADDLVVKRVLGVTTARAADAAAAGWRPWRAYAVVHLWRSAWTEVATPIGAVGLYASDEALVRIRLPSEGGEPPAARRSADDPVLRAAADAMAAWFAGEQTAFALPLRPAGTPFQIAVWEALAAIPYGARRSYGDIAAAIGRPKAVRAVGAANGRNPLPIVVPCHRVIGADGSLTGFGGGLAAKAWLLDHEARVLADSRPAAHAVA